MPPSTPDQIATRRIHNLIGMFAVAVFFFFVAWLAGRNSDAGASPLLLWLFALMAAACLGGWIFLSMRRVQQTSSLVDKLMK